MLSIPLLPSGTSLDFSLPFPFWPLAVRWLVLLGLPALMAALLLRLYRQELRFVPRRVALLLAALRLAVLAVIVLMLFLQPSVVSTRQEEVPGRVLLALDRSESCRLTDPQRSVLEKLILAKALRLVGDILPERQLDEWIGQAQTSGTPSFLPEGDELGAADRDKFRRLVQRLDELTRLDLTERGLQPGGSDLIGRLQEKHAVHLVGFDTRIGDLPLEIEKRQAALASKPSTMTEGPKPPSGTDLKLPLQRASESAGDASGKTAARLLGVVVFTDGRHNWGESPLALAAELGSRRVPIFPVQVAPAESPPDVAVVSAKPQSAVVFKGSTVPIEANVRVSGWPAGPVKVKLELPPDDKGVTPAPLEEIVDHTGTDANYPLSFKAKLDVAGPQTLVVKATGTGANDRFPENNSRTVRVNAVKDRARVMLIDGEARWEFHYLHTCLGRDENMDVRSVVFRQPRITRATDDDLKQFGTPASRMPADPDALAPCDCIVLGDVEPDQISLTERLRLEKYVAEDGGTLVILAGKRAMPMAYLGLERDPIRKLLPVRNPRAYVDSRNGFAIQPTEEGRNAWFLQLGDTPTENREAWAGFPRHYWSIVGEAKPAAEVLARTGVEGEPCIVRQNYGFGRVLFVGIDSTWRWRFKIGDHYHHRFWGQVAQWAASDRLLPASNAAGTIKFGTREPSFRAGQEIELVVRTSEVVKKPSLPPGARIIQLPEAPMQPEKIVIAVPLAPPDGRTREWTGKARPLPPGKYAVELDVPDWLADLQGSPGPDGRAMPLRSTFEVLPPEQEELVVVSANDPLLQDMASTSGGELYRLETLPQLIDRLQRSPAMVEHRTERPFRKSWWMLGLLVGLLSCEWAVRKWSGLP